jgi:hypothetical protein
MLDFLVRRFLIPLHIPFANKASTNVLFHYSRRASADTAMAIIHPEPNEHFSHLVAVGGGLFKDRFRSAITAISLELFAQVEADRLDGTLHRESQPREVLKQAVRDSIALSITRIRYGETNIKLHTYLCMILAQVEASETGASAELKIAQSARDSVELCYGLLVDYAGSVPFSSPDDTYGADGLGNGQDFVMDFDLGFFMPDAVYS